MSSKPTNADDVTSKAMTDEPIAPPAGDEREWDGYLNGLVFAINRRLRYIGNDSAGEAVNDIRAQISAEIDRVQNRVSRPSPSPAIGYATCRVCGGDGDEPTPPNVSRPCHNCGGTCIEKPAVRKLLNLFWSECITSDVDIEAQRLIASLLGKFSDYHNLDWGKP